MFIYPNILKNPSNPIYNLEEDEIYALKETEELILIEKYSYSLFAFYTSVLINLKRRIESFGVDIFLSILEKEEEYNRNANSLKERWLNINEYKIIEYAKNLNIINVITFNMISTLFWMKSNTNEEENKNLSEEEILSIIYLIEKNLFLHKFKEDKRGTKIAEPNSKMKFRRKSDNNKKDLNSIPRTHHDLLMKSGMKIFENQSKKTEEQHNLDQYG